MAIYQKINGVWTVCQRPYLYRGGSNAGTWVPVVGAWVKRSGTWVKAYEYDVLPPNPPEIDLILYEDRDAGVLKSRWIRVGIRLPGSANDPDARRVRVLTTYNGAAPTTKDGGTYTSAADDNYPDEPWSEWRYNSYGVHKDTSVTTYKTWPRSAKAGNIIKGEQRYYFTAWAQDSTGPDINWSVGTAASIWVPKAGVDAANVVLKEARFQPNTSGSWRGDGYQSGDLIQQNSPRSVGLWFMGNQITDSVGSSSGTITVKSAQIYIKREDDGGQANANIYLFWHPYGGVGDLPTPGSSITKSNRTLIGTLAKGQGKWFDLPTAYLDNLNTQVKGFGLDYKDPIKASAFPEDYSDVTSVATNIRSGEVHIVWTEEI